MVRNQRSGIKWKKHNTWQSVISSLRTVDADELSIHHSSTGDIVVFVTIFLQGSAFIEFRDFIKGNAAHDFLVGADTSFNADTSTPRSVLDDVPQNEPGDVTPVAKDD